MMDSETLSRLQKLADKGGLAEGAALEDMLAEGVDQLMFFKGDKVAVLECLDIDEGLYLGLCEGVLGKFNRAHVDFPPDIVLPSPPSSFPWSSSAQQPPVEATELSPATPTSPPAASPSDPTPPHIALDQDASPIPPDTEPIPPLSSSPDRSLPSSTSPPSPPEPEVEIVPVPRRRSARSGLLGEDFIASSEDIALELEKKRRRRGDPGALMNFEGFVLPTSTSFEQPEEAVQEKEKEVVVESSKEAREEEEHSDKASGSDLEVNIPPVDSTFEFDDGALTASSSVSGPSPFPSSSDPGEEEDAQTSSPRRESVALGSNLKQDNARASSVLDDSLLFPLPPTHEAIPPSSESDEPSLPSPPRSHDFHPPFPSHPPLQDCNLYPRKSSHPNEFPSSSSTTFPTPNSSPRRASIGSPSQSPLKQLKTPSSRSLAKQLASSYSSSTLASRHDDDGDEEWDIFADYARASMYEPDFAMEAGSDPSRKAAARQSKRISWLPSSLSQEFTSRSEVPSTPPKQARPAQPSVWNPRCPETLAADGPARTSLSTPLSSSTPPYSISDSPATLVGQSHLSPASPTTPPSPSIYLATPESPETELRALSPSGGGLASNLREMIIVRNQASQASSRRGSEEEGNEVGKVEKVEKEKPQEEGAAASASKGIEAQSVEPEREGLFASEFLPDPAASQDDAATSDKQQMPPINFFTPSPSARSLKPTINLTIDTNVSKLAKTTSSHTTEPSVDLPSRERSRCSSAASNHESLPSPSAFHGRTDIDLSSSPGPVPISFFVGNQSQGNSSPLAHPFSSVSPPLSPTSTSVGLGLGLPSTPTTVSHSTHSPVETAQGWADRGRSPPVGMSEFGGTAGEAGAGSFGRGSPSSLLRGGATPRPGFFPAKERPRSRSFSSFSGQTVELGYPLYTETPSSPGSPNSLQQSFVSLSSSPHFPSNSPSGFRDHRPIQSSLAIVGVGASRYPYDRPAPRPDSFGRRNSDRPRIQSSTYSSHSPNSPLVPSQLSTQSSLPPSKQEKDRNSSPKNKEIEFPSAKQPSSPMAASFSPSLPPPTAVVEPPTPKRGGFFNIFRSRSASMSSPRASIPVVAVPPPVPVFSRSSPAPTSAPAPPPSSPHLPPPIPLQAPQLQQQQPRRDSAPLASSPNPFGPLTPSSPPFILPPASSPARLLGSPSPAPLDLPSPSRLVPLTPETPSTPFSAAPSHRSSPPRRLSTSTTVSLQNVDLSRQSSVDATSIDLNPPMLSQGRSSSSLSSTRSLRSPKSISKMRKGSAALSPSKRTIGLPPAVSSKDFQEESVQEGGFEFELLKPLARKASLERRRSTDALGSNADEQLQPPKSVVPRRSASAETPTLKPLLETDEFGFYLRPGKKATKPQGGPSGEESRALEAKWLGIISTTTLVSVQKNKKNKKLVRGGLPASLRGRIWAFLLESHTQRRQGLFDQLCVVAPATFEMEEAAAKAFPDHEQFNEPNSGRNDLLSLLRSYGQLNQQLGLQPGMAAIGGTLLMSSPAEDSFWLFASVVDSIRTLYRKDLAVESLVFVYLLETLDKPLARRIIVDAKIDPKTILSRWLQPMFIRILPWKDLLRVLDVTFFEGPSYLLRIALAIVLGAKDRLLSREMRSVDHIKMYLMSPPQDHLLSADTLIPLADGLKISTKDEDLRKLRSKAMAALEEGRAAMRNARRQAGVAKGPVTPGPIGKR